MKPELEVVVLMKLGLLGCSRTCLRGPSIMVVGSKVGEEGNGCGTME